MNKRMPRKAKKWAKKNKVQLIIVRGKRKWYMYTARKAFYVGSFQPCTGCNQEFFIKYLCKEHNLCELCHDR